MSSAIQVSTFTPVESNNPFTYYPAAYLSPLSGVEKVAMVIDPVQLSADGSRGCTSKALEASCLSTAFKIITYIASLGILPLLAWLLTVAIRVCSPFHYVVEEGQNPRRWEPRDVVSNPPLSRPEALVLKREPIDTPSNPSLEKMTKFNAFKEKCLQAEAGLEDFIHRRAPGAEKLVPEQIKSAIDRCYEALQHERFDLQKLFSTDIVPSEISDFLENQSHQILVRISKRQGQYSLQILDEQQVKIQREYEQGIEQAEAALAVELEELEKRTKARQAIEQAAAERMVYRGLSGKPFVSKQFAYFDVNHYHLLQVARDENNMVQAEISSFSDGTTLKHLFQHEEIEWRTPPTFENIQNPDNWSSDGAKVIFEEQIPPVQEEPQPVTLGEVILTKELNTAPNTYFKLMIVRGENNKIFAAVETALHGAIISRVIPNEEIEWRALPTSENVEHPDNWFFDENHKLVFSASILK